MQKKVNSWSITKEKLCILKDVKTAICAIEFSLQYKYKLVSLWQIIANRKFG